MQNPPSPSTICFYYEYMTTTENADYIRKTIILVRDRSYNRIIELLKKKPLMTVNEIQAAYNENQSEKDQKSENTVYRYLKTLISAKLIMAAGQRVTIGKTATETLFNVIAAFFMTPELDSAHWSSDWGEKISSLMASIFEASSNDVNPSAECVQKTLIKYTNLIEKKKIELLQNLDEDFIENLQDYNIQDLNNAFRQAGLIMIYQNPKAIEKLWECIK